MEFEELEAAVERVREMLRTHGPALREAGLLRNGADPPRKRPRMIIDRTVRFGSDSGETWVTVEATIDTGSHHCQIRRSTAEALGARHFKFEPIFLADGRIEQEELVWVQLELDPSLPIIPASATVGGEEAAFIVGVLALEMLGIGIDPETGRLVPRIARLLHQSNWPTL